MKNYRISRRQPCVGVGADNTWEVLCPFWPERRRSTVFSYPHRLLEVYSSDTWYCLKYWQVVLAPESSALGLVHLWMSYSIWGISFIISVSLSVLAYSWWNCLDTGHPGMRDYGRSGEFIFFENIHFNLQYTLTEKWREAELFQLPEFTKRRASPFPQLPTPSPEWEEQTGW